jgi:hypothetical protein
MGMGFSGGDPVAVHPDWVGTPCAGLTGSEECRLKVARIIADLAGSAPIRPEPLQKAIHYRRLDWNLWV